MGHGMHSIDAMFFDLGDVLVHRDDELLLRRLAERAGRTPGKDEAARYEPAFWSALETGRIPPDRIRAEVCRRAGIDPEALSDAAFRQLWGCHFEINREIVPLLAELEDTTRFHLVSNTNAIHFDIVRPKIPFLECFAGFTLSFERGVAKPDAAFYRQAIDAAGVAPERIAYFEDRPDCVAAARALGIRAYVYQDVATFRSQLEMLQLYTAPFDPAGPPKTRFLRL